MQRTKAVCFRIKYLGTGSVLFKVFSLAIQPQCVQSLLELWPDHWHLEPLYCTKPPTERRMRATGKEKETYKSGSLSPR